MTGANGCDAGPKPNCRSPVAGLLLVVTIRAATPYAAVAAAIGIPYTGGYVAGIIAQPLVGILTNSGALLSL